MSKIDTIFSALDAEQKDRLTCAFQQEFSQLIKLGDDLFISVHTPKHPKMEVIEESGPWIYGRIRGL